MTIHLILLSNNEPVGTLDVTATGDGATNIRYRVDNNGRGAKLDETLRLDAGAPSSWTIDGTSLMGGTVAERYARDANGVSTWSSQADEGSTDAPGFYLPADGSPFGLALLVERALATGDRVALLPEGFADVRPVLLQGDFGAPIEAFRITGAALGDQYVLRSPDGRLLGIHDHDLLLTDELVPSAAAIGDALHAATRVRYAEVSEHATLHAAGTLAITGVRVLDPGTGMLSRRCTIMVKDDRITDVLDGAEPVDTADTVVDAGGRVAVPGLHDMHAHLTASAALLYIAAGVTTVRDMGNENHVLEGLMGDIATGDLVGPSVVPAGFIEGRTDFAARLGRVVANLDEALAAVDWYADHGFHAVKIYNSFSPDWVRPTAERAHALGMRVQGHVPAFMNADRAIADGYDEITHLNQLALGWVLDADEDTRTPLRLTALARIADLDLDAEHVQRTMRTMVERGVGLDTTLVIIEQLMLSRARTVIPAHEPIIDHMPAGYRRYRKRTYLPFRTEADLTAYDVAFRRLTEITSRLHTMGVQLWPGTDDGTGVSLHRELELYVDAGISAAETLRIATAACAEHLHRGAERGAIEPGRIADFFLVDDDPTQDIRRIRHVALTIAEGRLIAPARIYEAFGVVPWTAAPTVARLGEAQTAVHLTPKE